MNKVLDNLAAWLFIKIIRYWRWRAKRSGTKGGRLTVLFTPATETQQLSPRQQNAHLN
jgi:hypothetical protein